MMILVDQISLRTLYIIFIKLRYQKNIRPKSITIALLNKLNSEKIFLISKYLLSIIKIKLINANFYVGDSYTKNNENIWTKAKHLMEDISYEMSRETLRSNKWINDLNNYWKKNTLLLFMSKYYFENSEYKEQTMTKYLIADMIARKNKGTNVILIINRPYAFNENLIKFNNKCYKVFWYSKKNLTIKTTKLYTLIYILYNFGKAIKNDFLLLLFKKELIKQKPKILLIQEGILSMDRSIRSQPHWVFEENVNSKIQVEILVENRASENTDHINLKKNNVNTIQIDKTKSLTIVNSVQKEILKKLIFILFKKNKPYNIQLIKLHLEAYFYIGYCLKNNIKAFMASENYLPITTVMNMIPTYQEL